MADNDKSKNVLDCSGLCCSLPLVEARMKLDQMKAGETLEVIATCSSAEKDIELLTSLKQFDLIKTWKEDDQFHFLIKKIPKKISCVLWHRFRAPIKASPHLPILPN